VGYKVSIISPDRKDELYARYDNIRFHMSKADIHGVCIKLYTTSEVIKTMWQDNFYAMSDTVRSHGRVIQIDDPEKGMEVEYEPSTSTAFLYNFDYYGWVKSVALAVAGDILEDDHHIHSVHGAALDVDGRGITMIAPSKTGKTTHSWGLLRRPDARLITDDWFFVRMSERRPLGFGSEKNCYIDSDIGQIWGEFQPLVENVHFDNKQRAIVNVRWVTGRESVIPMATMHEIILLKRDYEDPRLEYEMTPEDALEYLIQNDLCNPHQMVRDERKLRIRHDFFRRFLSSGSVHMVNTISSPQETQEIIIGLLDTCRRD
jgi:hypothetical protein